MKKQPVIKVSKPGFTKILDMLTILIFLAAIIYLFVQFPGLPDRVPGHYDAAGNVDRWGSKMELLILPLVGIGLWIGMTVLEKRPHLYNYLNLREDNVEAQYRNGILMMNLVKNECILLFSFLIYQGVAISAGGMQGMAGWILPLLLFIILGTTVIFMIKMLRL